ncbi:MAG TPA: hypothetical protein VGD78_06350 [Chthoniobacterales bacterium]
MIGNERTKTVERPALLEAIDTTLRTIESRTRLYRNLVVLVSLTALGLPMMALLLHQWTFLIGLLALPAYVGAFLVLDGRVVRAWRDEICRLRNQRELNVAQLKETLTAFRYIPAATLREMLAMLSPEKPRT